MYKVIELQTTDGVTSHIVHDAESVEKALSKYHEVLMYAAISNVEKHACVVLADNGNPMVKEYFEHPKEVIEETTAS